MTPRFIAIMLGRFKMSIDECLKKYEAFMNVVFDPDTWWSTKKWRATTTGAQWSAEPLEKVIKDLIRERMPGRDPEEVLLMDEESKNDRCKVFCMAVSQDHANNRAPVMFRSYLNPLEVSTLPTIKLWEAARATSAAPYYFTPLKVGNYTFVDGGLQANNPLGWLWNEVLSVFGPTRPTSCFLSIGTGVDQAKSIPSNLMAHPIDFVHGMVGAATNTEVTNILFRSLINSFAPKNVTKKYWRFNVGDGLPDWVEGEDGKYRWVLKGTRVEEKIGDLDDVNAIPETIKKAADYLGSDMAKGMVGEAATALRVEVAAA